MGSLTPISPMSVRRRAWKEVSGKELGWHRFDVADNYDRLLSLSRSTSRMRWCTSPSSGPRLTR